MYYAAMDIKTKLQAIKDTGLTQQMIATLISTDSDKVIQAVVQRYLSGYNTKMPYDRAARVDALYKKLKRQNKIKSD